MQRPRHAASALSILSAACLAFFISACGLPRPDVIQAGPWYPKSDWEKIEVFSSRGEIRRPWGGTAVIHGPQFRAGDEEELSRQKTAARKAAARTGADAVLIGVEETPSPEDGAVLWYISALAIKYVDTAGDLKGK